MHLNDKICLISRSNTLTDTERAERLTDDLPWDKAVWHSGDKNVAFKWNWYKTNWTCNKADGMRITFWHINTVVGLLHNGSVKIASSLWQLE